MLSNHGVGAEGLLAGQAALNAPADAYGNDSRVEELWAMKAMDHAEVYFNLLCSVEPKRLKLSGSQEMDDKIYNDFREKFPALKIDKLTEDDLKSESAKSEWRAFAENYKDLEDYSLGTLLRLDSSQDYSEANTIIAIRIQFLALEIARNREGANDGIKANFKPTARKAKNQKADGKSGGLPTSTKSGVPMSELEHELAEILSGNHQLMK